MEKEKAMEEIFSLVSGMTKAMIEKEKETTLSDETYRMISLTQSLYHYVGSNPPPEIF